MRWVRVWPAAAVLSTCLPAAGFAHGGLVADRVQVVADGTVVQVHATPRPGAFGDFDSDGDGELEAAEVEAQREALLDHVAAAIQIVGSDGANAETVLRDLNVAAHLHEGEAPYIRITLRFVFEQEPAGMRLRWGLPIVVPMTVVAVSGHELQTTGHLDAAHTEILLFE